MLVFRDVKLYQVAKVLKRLKNKKPSALKAKGFFLFKLITIFIKKMIFKVCVSVSR